MSLRLRAGLLLVGGMASSAVLGLLNAPHATAAPQDGFTCNEQVFQAAGGAQVRLYTGTAGTGTISFAPLGPAVAGYNAIGVDPKTRYIFGLRGSNRLVRIDNKGAVTDLGPVTGLPAPARGYYVVGAFDPAGDYYVMNPDASATTMYRVNVSTRTVLGRIRLSSRVLPGMADFTYSGGYLWGAASNGTIQRISPTTGVVTNFAMKAPATTSGYGGAFTYANGDLGLLDNKGVLIHVAVANPGSATPAFKVVARQPSARPATSNDATACSVPQPRADLQITKTGPASVRAGAAVTYKITVTNKGPDASSGWTVEDTLPSALANPRTSSQGCTVTGSHLSCRGSGLAVGASTTVLVSGTAPAPTLDNTATVRGKDTDPVPGNNTSSVTTHVV